MLNKDYWFKFLDKIKRIEKIKKLRCKDINLNNKEKFKSNQYLL